MNPLYWIPVVIIYTTIGVYTSIKSNNDPSSTKWFICNWMLWALPVWSTITLYSKNIAFDGVLYDIILIIAYGVASTYMLSKSGQVFSTQQMLGLAIMIIGIIVFKVKL